ncbi:DUF5063 domain-containing protein [Bacteroidia bacterium]|nr:DUF5063 domain-containing protein [Bacteroidia bacterium]
MEINTHIVYSQQVIEFTTVVAESCRFLENLSEIKKTDFIQKALKLFPLLYLKTIVLEMPENEEDNTTEQFVGEEDYDFVKDNVAQILGEDDSFLDTFHPDMPLSDTPIAATVSENIADVYQEIRDYAANYQSGYEQVMSDALFACLESFGEHWGQKLLNTIRALHALKFKN